MRLRLRVPRPVRSAARDERGAASVEVLGTLPYLLLAALAAWQLLLVAWTVTSASNAARTGSRVEGRGGDGKQAALDSLSGALRGDAKAELDGDRAEVEVEVPIIFPGLSTDDVLVTREAELPETPEAIAASGGIFSGGPYSIPTYIVMCESGGDYSALNPSTMAGGAYQIIPSTWRQYGGEGFAHEASKEEQDRIAARIWRAEGSRPWECAR